MESLHVRTHQASASEASGGHDIKRNQASSSQGSEILRTKKEVMLAYLDGELPSARTRAGKRTKVIKYRLPQRYIDHIKSRASSPILDELSEEELANEPKFYRDAYAESKVLNDKIKAYYHALIEQHDVKGYAEDEAEVTDDEEEMAVVVSKDAPIRG
ncbi:hypothetical protein HU200_004419 [Digitaria exilis]|uniref:Uncharacterized protein n=1 Tax=Digitaria exilis TaxID=1010633 RepID=A0A835KV41_9POAL|nr:hypothetical protein HU200_004419 [Digitaria exilis]